MSLIIKKAKKLIGRVRVPGDKSVSHRAVMFGGIAKGITEVENFLTGEDCLSTVRCFKAMGVEVEETGPTSLRVLGKGLMGLEEPGEVLDVGNSGTTMRLMLGILAGQPFFAALTGDDSIRRRPMGRVTEPLRQMGAEIWGRQQGKFAPLAIRGGNLRAMEYNSPVASAQVKSALLLAGLYAHGVTVVEEPEKSRDHTERMLRYLGARVDVDGNRVSIHGKPELTGKKITVPGDISSAAFFLVAGSIIPDSEIILENVGVNPTRDGIIEVLQNMGADLQLVNLREVNCEPVADIIVRSSSLRGTEIGGALIPRLIDEIPVLAVAAAMATGETVIKDAEELKVKESNRIATVVKELSKFGVAIEELPDGMRIKGGKTLTGAVCESYHDHRIAMAMAVAGLSAQGETEIKDPQCIDISFPGFAETLASLQK
ncbi:MAG: 3-phosphoshikimate 1-carboxyvinyltransferase [Clostridia bacterium]|nr:3-phosphoshikimate 1-carboxyvinyltransferase [Clostridia bacterium]